MAREGRQRKEEVTLAVEASEAEQLPGSLLDACGRFCCNPGSVIDVPECVDLISAILEKNCVRFDRINTSLHIRHAMSLDVGQILDVAFVQLSTWNGYGAAQVGRVGSPGVQYLLNPAVATAGFLDSDGSWMSHAKWATVPVHKRPKRVPCRPDFVLEVRSHSQSLLFCENKMRRWIAAGVQSGMLIDPIGRQTYVYARGNPAGGGHPSNCPLLGANAGAAIPANVSRVVGTHGRVWRHHYGWGANVVAGGRTWGPNLQVPGVGLVNGLVISHADFPMD